MSVSIPGISYQEQDIQSPVPGADSGPGNPRIDVNAAGAGMDQIAKAGKELETAGQKIVRQENITQTLKGKNEATIQNQAALLDFQSQLTGNQQQDVASWRAVADKNMQGVLSKYADNPAVQEHLSRELDSLHSASIMQVQKMSHDTLKAQSDTQTNIQGQNTTNAAMFLVKGQYEGYRADVDKLFQQQVDLINEQPLLSQAEKDIKIQGFKDYYYFETAKYQAEVSPGAFSRDWRDGVFKDRLSPEKIVALEPFAKKAEVDNAYSTVTQQFMGKNGSVDYAAAVRFMRDPKNFPDMPLEQRSRVESAFQTADAQRWQQIDRTRHELEYSTSVKINKAVQNGQLDVAYSLATNPNSGLTLSAVQGILANLSAGAQKVDDPAVFKEGMNLVTNGGWSDNWGMQQQNEGKMTYSTYEKLRKMYNESEPVDMLALKSANTAVHSVFGKPLTGQGSPGLAKAEMSATMEIAGIAEQARLNKKRLRDVLTPEVVSEVINKYMPDMNQQIQFGLDRFNMGNTTSPSNRPTPAQASEIMRGLGVSSAPGAGSTVTLAPQDTMRKPGETWEQWTNRTRGM